jgi:hypothetical protein
MKIQDSKATIIHADNFAIEYKYCMTIEHDGDTYYWNGFIGDFGSDENWYDSKWSKIRQPDWADDLDSLFDLCEEKIKYEKVMSGRTECGFEVEEALVKELILQGFPEEITRKVIRTYPIDRIIFESILKEASIKIDELHKEEVK